ncbi:hypothetical protein D5F01_LYC21755 [Larimichthys crocea]|uniref:C2H2-type domain-containing protein n=1 Tax=Larimichthys crocea TaxID=215358 RepID=A0A6G0HKP5_LARCR|nr:hypothetical protein D5F01_LYC21755 [Larimichthys crocea]
MTDVGSDDGGRSGPAGKAAASSIASGNGKLGRRRRHGPDNGGENRRHAHRREQSHGGKVKSGAATEYYEVVEYSMPAEEEEVAVEEEEDSVYVIEYSNPEEEGESYQFTMPRQKRKLIAEEEVRKEEEEEEEEVEVVSNKSVLELGEDYRDVMEMNSGSGKRLVCSLCPPPGRFFKRGSGLAVHLKQMHQMVGKKTFFCTSCQQPVRTQVELDAHTRRHANQDAVFTCVLCSAENKAGFEGSRWGLKRHLEKEHPGVVPRCHICNKGFKTLASYLTDQFRHVGVSPYYCAKCQIYEMTQRGLSVHIKNHDKKKKRQESAENLLQTTEAPVDNSATDDSDF